LKKVHTPDAIKYDVSTSSKSKQNYKLTDLYGGYAYTVSIQAVNQAGTGLSNTLDFNCPVYKPLNTNRSIDIDKTLKTPQTITIWIEKNFFSDKNGEITHYQVIVSEIEKEMDYANDTAPAVSYSQAKKTNGIWPVFYTQDKQVWFSKFETQLKEYNMRMDENTTKSIAFSYVIGLDQTCTNEQVFCNGPLKPGTLYRIKIRGFNKADYVDTPYSDLIRTPSMPNSISSMNTIISIVVSLCVIAVLSATLAFLIIKCRHSHLCIKRANPIHHEDTNFMSKSSSFFSAPIFFGVGSNNKKTSSATADASTMQTSMSLNQLSSGDKQMAQFTSKPIKINEFDDHVNNLAKNSDYMFAIEFETFKDVGTEQPHQAADLPINRLKNRFTNILPYDGTRVKLFTTTDASQDGSDYINANYVPGNSSSREFIATQGPLSTTKNDFWKMSFDGNVKAIVMLTKCLEGNRERCERYWPTEVNTPIVYGNIEVCVLSEQLLGEWNITEIKMTRNGKSSRLFHFWYTTWPDFKVPDNTRSLINFIRIFRQHVRYGDEPIVVHCSAGVGRTGTFIAVDVIMQQIKTCDSVDIYGLVHAMRKYRVQMVQTETQYIFLHRCVSALLKESDVTHGGSVNFFDNFAFQTHDS
jgi:receptor-type tyrosine-protein phosphatase beta